MVKFRNICEANSQPLRRDIDDLREQVSALPNLTSGYPGESQELAAMRMENGLLRDQQREQMDILTAALEPLAMLKNVVDDVVLLRRDTNQLLERQATASRDSPVGVQDDREATKAVAAVRQHLKRPEVSQAPPSASEEPRVMPVRVEIPPAAAPTAYAATPVNQPSGRRDYPSQPMASSDDEPGYPTDFANYGVRKLWRR